MLVLYFLLGKKYAKVYYLLFLATEKVPKILPPSPIAAQAKQEIFQTHFVQT